MPDESDTAFASRVLAVVDELTDNDLTTKDGRVAERLDRAYLAARRKRSESTWLKQAIIASLLSMITTALIGVATWFVANVHIIPATVK